MTSEYESSPRVKVILTRTLSVRIAVIRSISVARACSGCFPSVVSI